MNDGKKEADGHAINLNKNEMFYMLRKIIMNQFSGGVKNRK